MKVLYVSTISNTIIGFVIPHIELLLEQGHQVDVACNVYTEIDTTLKTRGIKVFNMEFSRSPLSKNNITAYRKLKSLIRDEGYDLVHTHTPVASVCVRLACRNIINVKVFYTAHGFHFFKGAPIANWLIYYPIERWLAKYTDVLITINKEDYERAKKSFKAGRIEYIPGVGLDTEKFIELVVDKYAKRRELNIQEDAFVVLSVGELNKNKNHETVIKAIASLNNANITYIICGLGPLEDYLKKIIKELGLEKQVKLIGYRSDIAEICKAADVFVFPSFREGLSVALMEAMACGLPVVCSDIRGNKDLIENEKGGYLVHPSDVAGYVEAINKLRMTDEKYTEMHFLNIDNIKNYNIKKIKEQINEIYTDVLEGHISYLKV